MNFQFCLAGTPIEPHEAVALLEIAAPKGSSKPMIDISTIIDTKELNASKLFELAVSKQNQDLASLAWKISVQQKQPATFGAPKLKVVSSVKEPTLEGIIEQLNGTNSYCALGTAMLLKATSFKQWVTLRETATYFAGEIVNKKLGFPTSKFLRGFEMVEGKPTPIDLSSGIERKHTFHVSPMYIALREGLVYCKKHGLVEQKQMLSVAPRTPKTVLCKSTALGGSITRSIAPSVVSNWSKCGRTWIAILRKILNCRRLADGL